MKRGREPATVLRPFFMLAGRWFGDAERGCGRALSRASGDALLRARPSCSGPRAHLRTGGGSDQRARAETTDPVPAASHMVLCRRLFRRCDLLSGRGRTSLPSACQVVGEGLLTRPRRRAGKFPQKHSVFSNWHWPRNGEQWAHRTQRCCRMFHRFFKGIDLHSRDAATDLPVMHEADSRFAGKSLCHKALNKWANFPFSYRLPVI